MYGMRIRSFYPLPFQPAPSEGRDLVIYNDGYLPPAVGSSPPRDPLIWRQEKNDWVLRYSFQSSERLEFRFNEGEDALRIRHCLDDRRDPSLLLLGMGLAAALHLRDVPILHAASVLIGGAAVVFVGESGQGKSTLVGGLTLAGCPFLCDDLSALYVNTEGILVAPGHPLLKMKRGTALALGIPEKWLQPVFHSFPGYDERWLDTTALPGGFAAAPTPLGCIYFIVGREPNLQRPVISPISPGQGCLQLTRHLYGCKWLGISQERALSLCSRIARGAVFRRLLLPDGIHTIPSSVADIMADAAAPAWASLAAL